MIDSHDCLQQKLELCQRQIGYEFGDLGLLRQCLTHASAAITRAFSNERLEFLGDAILGAAVCDELFARFPECAEGELTRMKSALVSRSTCARIAEQLQLTDCLMLGKGLEQASRLPKSVRAGVTEAVIAGVYLDGGFEAVRAFISRVLEPEFERLLDREDTQNFKSRLQQLCQKHFATPPEYRLLDERGPDHSKAFQVAAVIEDRVFEPGWGPNKKEAEQRAAQAAYNALAQEIDPGGQ